MQNDSRIFVAGHRGLVGAAITRNLRAAGYRNLIERSRSDLDLTRQSEVEAFFNTEKPEYVFLAAAKVGGIHANDTQRAEFIYQNMMIAANVIDASWKAGVEKLLFLGSSCIYPRMSPQPISETALLSGALEPTNEPYSIAKIAGLKLCENYRRQYGFDAISLMPTNLYGPGDNFDLEASHVIPALMRKAHEAKLTSAPSMIVWGTGAPRREFLHVDDLADAAVFLMHNYSEALTINVGVGHDVTISELVEIVRDVVGFEGTVNFDTSKPDGTPRKMLEVGRLRALGWSPKIALRDGLAETYRWFLNSQGFLRSVD
ncbi:MAG: GDP-L-fucose synthase [Pseudomonadota bacterium]|nr:GDP-L-fucose synthase [Pseudomonadota bacterium]